MSAPAPDPTPARKRIVAVDDEEIVRDVLSKALSRSGYDIVTAASGPEALEMLLRGPHTDLIIADLKMPIMDGRTLIRRVREEPALVAVPVLFLSGLLTEEIEEGYPCLAKPVDLRELVETVRRLTTPG